MDQSNGYGPSDEPKGAVGPMVGAIIIIVLLIIGALYFWGDKLKKETSGSKTEAAIAATSSDEVGSLETDVSAAVPETGVDLSNLETEQ